MRIPSYDDLTPSIPDISPGEVFSAVPAVLRQRPRNGRPGSKDPGPTYKSKDPGPTYKDDVAPESSDGRSDPGDSGELYAALHDPGDGGVAAIDRLMTIARDFSPRIERRRGGTVVLDVSGLQRLFGDARSIADHLARAGAPHVAIAVSQTAAILLARARPGVTVAAREADAALHDVPLTRLQELSGEIDGEPAGPADRRIRRTATARPRTFDVLRRWGLTTLGEFAALPAAELSARLGAMGIAHQRLARGFDPRPLVPDPGVRRFIASFELEWPIDTLEPLSFVFARLLDPLAAALEQADRGGVALHLRLRLSDRTTHVRTLGLPAPMRDPRVLRTLLLLDLESHPPSAAVDVVTIEIDPAPARVVQYSLLERPVPSSETIATLMARLGALVGETRCGSPQLLDTYRPDGWTMASVTFDDRGCLSPEGGSHAPGPAMGEHMNDPTRPAMSEHMNHASRMALRRFRPPVAVRVSLDGGRPARIAIDRRGMPGGAVRQAAGPWRTSGGWWHGDHWNRDEWDVAFEGGAVCRIYQDRDAGAWFVEGIYD